MELVDLLVALGLFFLPRPVASQTAADYSDSYGRTIFDMGFYMVSDTPATCLAEFYPNYSVLTTIDVPCSAAFGTCRATLTVSTVDQTLMLFVKGSADPVDFSAGGLYTMASSDSALTTWSTGEVAQSYNTSFGALWSGGLEAAIQSAWNQYCDFKFIFGGHSIGGCLSQMIALRTVQTGMWAGAETQSFSYGSTRCGDQIYALAVDSALPYCYRVNNNEDIMPGLVATTCDRSSTPTEATAQECYWHACVGHPVTNQSESFQPAVRYTTSVLGTVTISRCDNPEDSTCTAATTDLSVTDDWAFFNRTNMAQYASFSC